MKQRGRMDSLTAAVGEAAASLRRRRESRRPYVKLYDDAGMALLLSPESDVAHALDAAAQALIDAVDADPPHHPPT